MGLDFLSNYGARRAGDYSDPPELFTTAGNAGDDSAEEESEEQIGLDYEVPRADWRPLDVPPSAPDAGWPLRPTRFVDGKDVGHTVAWLRSREGYPVPVRLAEIGGVVMRNVDGELRREFAKVERVVSMMTDPFPWDEVESFAMALQERGFRLLNCRALLPGENPYDLIRLRNTAIDRKS